MRNVDFIEHEIGNEEFLDIYMRLGTGKQSWK